MKEDSDSKRVLAEKVVRILEDVRERPSLYIYPMTAEGFINWDFGFEVGCSISGLSAGDRGPESLNWQITTERGWKDGSLGPIPDMRERGLDDATMVKELITIEIETWKRTYDLT